MNDSVNDTTANETAIKGKLISKLTREQFEKIASDPDKWEIVSHNGGETDDSDGVTYCEMSIRSDSIGIFVSGIQFASDEDGDVEDGFTSEHKSDDVKVVDKETNKKIVFPLIFGNDDASVCDKGWFLDLIDDVVNDKINEVADEYSASYDERDFTASLWSRKAIFQGSDVAFYDFVIEVKDDSNPHRKFMVTGRRLATGGSWGESVVCDPDPVFSDEYRECSVPRALAAVLIKVAEDCMEENLDRDYNDDKENDRDEDRDEYEYEDEEF